MMIGSYCIEKYMNIIKEIISNIRKGHRKVFIGPGGKHLIWKQPQSYHDMYLWTAFMVYLTGFLIVGIFGKWNISFTIASIIFIPFIVEWYYRKKHNK